MAKAPEPLKLSGRVFCSWNTFTMARAVPKTQNPGDLIVWSWSGNRSSPKSCKDKGVFRVSIYDAKGKRRDFKVVGTRVNALLNFASDAERGRNLRALVQELDALKDNMAVWR